MLKPLKSLRFAIIAVDVALFTYIDGELRVLLIKINRPPFFTNIWGLPGGLIHPEETAKDAVKRQLAKKGGVKNKYYLEQIYTFSRVNRDPRGRVVSVAYLALCDSRQLKNSGSKLPHEIRWLSIKKLPRLAYDHNEIIAKAIERLRAKLAYTNIAYTLLPAEFTLSELQDLYEEALGKKLDKRNFRKKFLRVKLLKPTEKKRLYGAHRPAKLYRFKARVLKTIEIL